MIVGLIVVLISAIGYTVASLILKAALGRGATANQLNLCVNVALALVVQPLWFFDRPEIPNAPMWQPIACCLCFFIGQLFTFAALAHGDVSVATPMMGAKVIFVTVLNAVIFQLPVSLRWWVAAGIASLAVALITSGGGRPGAKSVVKTALLALSSAFFFSLADVLVQHWGNASDELVFLPVMFGATGLFSVIYYLVLDRGAFVLKPSARGLLLFGAVLLGLQAVGMFLGIVWSGDATAANVMYATRCIWAVVAAWSAGHLLGLRDAEVGKGVMGIRLLGAILLFSAVILILI